MIVCLLIILLLRNIKKGNDITFHGLKKDKNLFEVINNSHIGVGSLGLKILNNYNDLN